MGCPQLGPWIAEERVPELSLPHYHADEYLEYYHRIFIQQQMEIETETLIRATDWAPKAQLKGRRREKMSMEIRTAWGWSTN